MKPILTIDELIHAARHFCEIESRENHVELIGVTDGKAVGGKYDSIDKDADGNFVCKKGDQTETIKSVK